MKLSHIAIALLLPTLTVPVWAGPDAKTQGKHAHPVAVEQTWDWSKIDTNKDHLIEPSEMEAWLAAHPGLQKGD